jgi:hypothetical protein
MAEPRIRIFLDDKPEPVCDYAPPATITIDTRSLADGEHRLRIEARDATGDTGIRTVPFIVRNGPGITISGLSEGATVHGIIEFGVNAFGTKEPFKAYRAESRLPTPVWMWVLSLVVAAWAAWYVVLEWNPPPELAKTPTFSAPQMKPF